MKYFVFRNYTLEPFFKEIDACFSGYADISLVDMSADRYIWFYCPPYKTVNKTIANEIRHYGDLLKILLSRMNTAKQFIIFTMVSLFKIDYQTTDTDIEEAIAEYNQRLYILANDNVNIKIMDIKSFSRRYHDKYLIDWKYYYIAQIPFNPKLAIDFTKWFLRQIEIIEMKRKKCIVVDLDNTLWDGVLGEDGTDGIKIGGDYPGNAFYFFQSYLLELGRKGIILTVCSKNNEADVFDIWKNHPDMLLRESDFVTYRINWNNKVDNIKDIAEELNIGLESMVFIDDSPSERELVKQMFPKVSVPDFPAHPYLLPDFVKKLTEDYFCAYTLTEEDYSKSQKYMENTKRVQYKNQFTDIDAYLKSLKIELTIEKMNEYNIARFAQMTQKTNQFNLTTKRYTESDIQALSGSGALVYGLRVKDKFGDNGLTGLMITRRNGKSADIDTLLLSCRILGKKIEYVFVNYILMKLKEAGFEKITATYIKTLKNDQVENFYDKLDFVVMESKENCKKYILELNKKDYSISDNYKVEEV
jgi:FkbH-like protein